MTNIYDLTNLIREARTAFQAKIIDAEQIKKRELESLKSDYIPGSKTYQAKQAEIEQTYTQAVINARSKLAEAVTGEIQSLKQFEVARVGRIDADVMEKVNSLRGIPMSAIELQAILDKHGSSYWTQRAVASLAEENGVSQSELKIPASIDAKLSVLAQLEEQLDKMMNDFDSKAKTPEASYARFLYLNDDILSNAMDIYNNHLHDISETDDATRVNYNRMWKNSVEKSAIGDKKIADLKKIHIVSFYGDCAKAGLKRNTIKLLHNLIFHPLNWRLILIL